MSDTIVLRFDVRFCDHPDWRDGVRAFCANCEPWIGLCGRYGHTGCLAPCEDTWVFCHEHRMAHCGPTDAENLAKSYERGAADMRERAALVSDDEERKAQGEWDKNRTHELPMPALRHVARRVRALPLTTPSAVPVDDDTLLSEHMTGQVSKVTKPIEKRADDTRRKDRG